MKKLLAVSTMLVMMFLFASCAKDDKMTIGSVIFEGTNEWFVEATAGMKAAAAEQGVNFNESDSRYDVAVERDLIREQVKNRVNAIVICPLTVEESGATLKEATGLGIPVVTWNSVVDPFPTAQVIVDSTMLGSATGDYLREYVQKNNIKKLKAAFIIDTSFSIGIERCDGFRHSVQPLIDSGVMEVAIEAQGNLHEATTLTVEKIMNEYPDINFIWCWNQMSTGAAVDVLKKMGRSDVIITGTDMSLALANEMLNSDVNLVAITTQQPYQMGYQAVSTAVKAAKGEAVEKSIVIPTLTYTKENADELKNYINTHKQYVKK